MEYIFLKNSDLKVSRLCMGGCPMGGHGWGEVNENDLIHAVHTAIDMGLNFFDTADIYGIGKSEETLGKALKGNRSKAIIATKFGVRIQNGKTFYDNSKDWINTAVEESLKRLDTDYIDLYHIHYRDDQTSLDSVIESLEELKEKGYIRYYGLSNIHKEHMEEMKAYIGKFISFQDEYSLACRKNEKDMFELSQTLQLTPMTWGSLGQGILSGKYDSNSTFDTNDRRSREAYVNFHGEKLIKNLEIVEIMKKIALDNGKTLPSIAIRFILDYIRDSVVIVGVKNAAQLITNTNAMGFHLSKEHMEQLLKVSYEDAKAPESRLE